MIILRMVSLISMMTMLILMIMMIDILMMMLIKGVISGTFRRSKTDPTLLRTEPVEAKAVDWIQKSETCDPEIQKSRNIEAKNPKSGSDMIQMPEKNCEADYRQIQMILNSPASYSKKNLIINCSPQK